jgi:hypothetical protein
MTQQEINMEAFGNQPPFHFKDHREWGTYYQELAHEKHLTDIDYRFKRKSEKEQLSPFGNGLPLMSIADFAEQNNVKPERIYFLQGIGLIKFTEFQNHVYINTKKYPTMPKHMGNWVGKKKTKQ